MHCCLKCIGEDFEELEKEYYKMVRKYDNMSNQVNELKVIVEELRHNNNILLNEYSRIKHEYNEFFQTYYNEIEKK